MTEGSATRMKRNGARLFKNPPQPHMCIQDFIQGMAAPCYVNVLSWDKIAVPCRSSQPVPLYGGMRVRPPRTKAEAVVFAVMANPEVLRTSGKNADDPKKRSTFIEVLFDFVEAMNTGIVFTRQYTILKDRDITGELKEVWNAVLARRDREQLIPQQETWIDAQPPVPQYPQYQEQQQQQPQQQEYTPQPPQYHTSVAYNRAISGEGMHYDGGYGHQPPNSVMSQNEQMYQTAQMVSQQYHGNVPRIAQDRYNYRERGRENLVQNIPQQNCPAYPAPYQFQQLHRQMAPQYVNSNMHQNQNMNYGQPVPVNTNINPGMNANLGANFQPYITYQPRMDNPVHVEIRGMPSPQPQQPQIHLNHVQPVPQYESTRIAIAMNATRLSRLHMGVGQISNTRKRQMNSPTRSKSPSCTNCQPKEPTDLMTSPVKVLQRKLPQTERQDTNNVSSVENNEPSSDNLNVEELQNLQVTDLDEETKNSTNSDSAKFAELPKQPNDIYTADTVIPASGQNTNCSEETPQPEERQQESKDVDILNGQNSSDQKNSKSKVFVIKVHKLKENTESNKTLRTRIVDQKADNQKFSQTTVNILKSVFKMHPGMSSEETTGKRKTNGQAKGNGKNSSENEDAQPGYTILKKSESTTQEEVANEIAQISIQDCKDATEVSPVLS